MKIGVIVEQLPGNGFKATGALPIPLEAEGPTREAALQGLQGLLEQRFENGAEFVSLDIPALAHSWRRYAGMLQDDPLFDEWQAEIARYRQGIEADALAP